MWLELLKLRVLYSRAVLVVLPRYRAAHAGCRKAHPSARRLCCLPEPDLEAQVLRLDLYGRFPTGPALLRYPPCGGLPGFVICGRLAQDEQGWYLRPVKLARGKAQARAMRWLRAAVEGD